MHIVCLDLEGVLVPEVWIAVAEKTGIAELRLTTRDIADYDVLMQKRIEVLKRHGLKLADIQGVIAGMRPLEGAQAFLDTLRADGQVVILSDTFYRFARPLMRQLDWPTLLCHELLTEDDAVVGYRLCSKGHKRRSVEAFQGLGYRVIAAGDSYNDTAMLGAAEHGILFRPPPNVISEFPQFPVTRTFAELRRAIDEAVRMLGATGRDPRPERFVGGSPGG